MRMREIRKKKVKEIIEGNYTSEEKLKKEGGKKNEKEEEEEEMMGGPSSCYAGKLVSSCMSRLDVFPVSSSLVSPSVCVPGRKEDTEKKGERKRRVEKQRRPRRRGWRTATRKKNG